MEVWRAIVERLPDMRFWVSFNRTLPTEIIRILADDADWRVRDQIAGRRDTPLDILETLSRDDHDAVLSTVADNPRTPTRALETLSGHSWSQIREKAERQLQGRRIG